MESDVNEMTSSSTHALILAAVNRGYSEEVMDAARAAGAAGGTVVHARRAGGEEMMKFWGISVQAEKELVLILARLEDKVAIMKAVGEKCGLQTEAQGMVLSLPVDAIAGMA